MDKRRRLLSKAIKPFGYKIDGCTGGSHYRLRNKKTGHFLSCSMSPKNIEHWIKNVIRDIQRYRT